MMKRNSTTIPVDNHRFGAACPRHGGNVRIMGAPSKIAVAAVELFKRKGYASTSVREIVEKAGVTRPSLYYYYGSKEGLYLELIRRGKLLIDHLFLEVKGAETGAWQKIEMLCMGFHFLGKHSAPELRMMAACILSPSDYPPSGKVEALFHEIRARLCTLLEEGQREGVLHFSSLDDAADLIECILFATSPFLAGRVLSASPSTAHLLDMAFRGLGALTNGALDPHEPAPLDK